MSMVQNVNSYLEKSEKPFDEVREEAIALAKQVAGKTQDYFQNAKPYVKLIFIKGIQSKEGLNVEIGVARDGRVCVESTPLSGLRTVHLISKRDNNFVVKDITKTYNPMSQDPLSEDLENCDSKHSLTPFRAGGREICQMVDHDPTASQPNQAQQAAGAPIADAGRSPKPIDEASIQLHQGQGSGSPDCGGGCNSKGCTIM